MSERPPLRRRYAGRPPRTDCSTEGSTSVRAPRAGRPDRMGARAVPPAIRAGPSTSTTIPAPTMASPGADQDHLAARRPGVQGTQARRPPSPAPAQALRRHDGPHRTAHAMSGWPAQAACDLIDHGRRHQRDLFAFLVEEEGVRVHLPALKQVHRQGDAQQPLHRPMAATTSTPPTGGKVAKDHTPRSAAAGSHQLGTEARIAAYSPARGRSERAFGTLQDRLVKELALAGIATVEAADRFIADTYLPDHNRRFATPAELDDSAFVPRRPPRPGRRHPRHASHRAHSRPRNTVRYETARPRSPLPRTSRPRSGSDEYPDGTLAALPRAPMRPLPGRRAHRTPTRQAA